MIGDPWEQPSLLGHTSGFVLPRVIARSGDAVVERFLEFFVVRIRNANTRAAYSRAVASFTIWVDQFDLPLFAIRPLHIAAYVEQFRGAPPSIKQNLAAIRMLFDWMVIGGALAANPAAAVRGPKHIVKIGKTPILEGGEVRHLLESISTSDIGGLRDRALIAVMVYSFARVGAVVRMAIGDCYQQENKPWFRFQEKGGRYHTVPAHEEAVRFVMEYVDVMGQRSKKMPMFCSLSPNGKLNERAMDRRDAWEMIKRRVCAAGLSPAICCHSFRATGITTFLRNGGALERAQKLAGHESPSTTKLYDRRADEITRSEIEKISF
jgi:site-specific recombinase XerD